jgi:hypothetical protein
MSSWQVEVPGRAQENHHRGRSTSLSAIDQRLKQILNTKVISGLDAVRALAVGLVLADHFLLTDHLFGFHPQTGSLGVMMFFVLSGFLITSMLLKEYGKSGTIALRNFYRRRLSYFSHVLLLLDSDHRGRFSSAPTAMEDRSHLLFLHDGLWASPGAGERSAVDAYVGELVIGG